MQLDINGKTYQFKFGYEFLKEVNDKYATNVRGAKVRTGALRIMLSGIFDEDIQTIAEVMKIANKTETEQISEGDLADYIADNIEKDFAKGLLDELKKSKFTKHKVNQMIQQMEQELM